MLVLPLLKPRLRKQPFLQLRLLNCLRREGRRRLVLEYAILIIMVQRLRHQDEGLAFGADSPLRAVF